ncbi:unnamed protein product [Ambrosiozyma monospora]|uniref:Unnamed protein product n=1 Tax=Ambrosiozyma monospora TaxID=43982 RepID=A0ACB5SXU0_AMBMO|nr:unnamed protein product [Ambrosiozyma monospora]
MKIDPESNLLSIIINHQHINLHSRNLFSGTNIPFNNMKLSTHLAISIFISVALSAPIAPSDYPTATKTAKSKSTAAVGDMQATLDISSAATVTDAYDAYAADAYPSNTNYDDLYATNIGFDDNNTTDGGFDDVYATQPTANGTELNETAAASSTAASGLASETAVSLDDLTDAQQQKVANYGVMFAKVSASTVKDGLGVTNGLITLINNGITWWKTRQSSDSTSTATTSKAAALNDTIDGTPTSELVPEVVSALNYAVAIASASSSASPSGLQKPIVQSGTASTAIPRSTSSIEAALDGLDPQAKGLGSLFGKIITHIPGIATEGLKLANDVTNILGGSSSSSSSTSSKEVQGKEQDVSGTTTAPATATSIDYAPYVASFLSSIISEAAATPTASGFY